MYHTLYAGYSRQNITPDFSVPLAGYGATHKRMSQNILSEIYATCIAFACGEEKLLLFTQDLIRTNQHWIGTIRQRISTKTGVAPDRILICSTHTHSAPDVYSSLDCMKTYFNTIYLDAMETAAVEALADLAPATLYSGETKTERMNFIRHYLLENGTYAGPNFGDFKSAPIVGHAAPNDPQLLVVKIDRGEKPGILMVNFQVHPTSTGGSSKTDLSADFVGAARDFLEASTGMHFAYFTGAAGNQVMNSKIPAEQDNLEAAQNQSVGGSHYMVYGWRLGQYVLKALADLKPMASSSLATTQLLLEQPLNHDDESLAEYAAETCRLRSEFNRKTAEAYCRPYGITSVYHANAILNRLERPKTDTMELNAVRIGDLAFVTMPYEVFCAHGVYIKTHSPFPTTMIFSCANQGLNYVPTAEAYEYGCYESFTSYFDKGSGEVAAEALTAMLNELK